MNIKALFRKGYKLVQISTIDFELVKDDKIIVHFEIDKLDSTLQEVYTRLLSEINYHIREIEEESEDYFHDELVQEEINYIKTDYYQELLDIRDWLI